MMGEIRDPKLFGDGKIGQLAEHNATELTVKGNILQCARRHVFGSLEITNESEFSSWSAWISCGQEVPLAVSSTNEWLGGGGNIALCL